MRKFNRVEKSILIGVGVLAILGVGKLITPSTNETEAQIADKFLNIKCKVEYESGSDISEKCNFYEPTSELLARWEAEKAENEKVDAEMAEMRELCSDLKSDGGTDNDFLIDQCNIVSIDVSN